MDEVGGWLEGNKASLPPCCGNPDAVVSFWLVLLVLTDPAAPSASSTHTPPALKHSYKQTHTHTHSHSHSINLPSLLRVSMESPSRLISVVCACIGVRARMCLPFCFFSISSLLCLPFVFPPLTADTCCNKVNEFGKWQDSRWYFSKQLPSINTVGEAGSWMRCLCVRAYVRACVLCALDWSVAFVEACFMWVAHQCLNAGVLLFADWLWGCCVFILFFLNVE